MILEVFLIMSSFKSLVVMNSISNELAIKIQTSNQGLNSKILGNNWILDIVNDSMIKKKLNGKRIYYHDSKLVS